MTPLYELAGIVCCHGQREALRVDALRIMPGALLGIVGPNGSGKSTLLRLLALLDVPAQGRLLFDGAPATPPDLAQRRQVTLLLQEPYLLHRNVLDNVGYGLAVRGVGAEARRAVATGALQTVGLDAQLFGPRQWFELSGGEAQRVALAARLALSPRVLLMDEPTASVDEESAQRICDAARAAHAQGTTVVVVSHDRDWLQTLTTDVLRLRGGRVID